MLIHTVSLLQAVQEMVPVQLHVSLVAVEVDEEPDEHQRHGRQDDDAGPREVVAHRFIDLGDIVHRPHVRECCVLAVACGVDASECLVALLVLS